MLVLRSSPASPFGRKVKVAAACLGLTDRLRVEPADTMNPEDSIRGQNPLGKIPALILEDGSVLYDSRVIVDHLDALAGGGRIIPRDGWRRSEVLVAQALADGIMDACLLQVYEGRFRPEAERSATWMAHQAGKVARGLAHLEGRLSAAVGETPDIGEIATACMLGYLDLRFAGAWRQDHPRLVAWLAAFEAAVPSFAATRPPA
jgi:glutathione S-transferase